MSKGAAQKIKERIGIVEVIGSYIDLQKSGGGLKARCPFHQEKTPSFFVSPERDSYYCFGCGAKGDIFTFVSEFESVDFIGALKILAEKVGVDLDDFKREKDDSQRLFDLLNKTSLFWRENLKNNKEALLYLKGRNLSIETVRDWQIGFAPSGWEETKNFLLSKNFEVKEMLEAGIIKQKEGGGFYDRFRGRIMFPIFDPSSRIVGFSGRLLNNNPKEAKYLNSPETKLFDKSNILFGIHKAKIGIREKGFALLVEGQIDLLMCHQIGLNNALATSGTAFTLKQAELIKRFTDTLVILYDADNAGESASLRAFALAFNIGFLVKIANLPKGKDPADLASSDPESLKKSVGEAKNVIEYFISVAESKDSKSSDKILKEIILPLIASVSSSIDKARYIQRATISFKISEKDLREELAKVKPFETQSNTKEPVRKKNEIGSEIDYVKKRILMLSIVLKKNKNLFLDFVKKIKEISGEIDLSFLEKINNNLVFEAEAHYGNSPNLSEIIDETLHLFEEETLKDLFAKSMNELKQKELTKDTEGIKELLAKCQEYSQKISNLNRKYFNKNK